MFDHRTPPKMEYLLALNNQVVAYHERFCQALSNLQGQLTNGQYQHNAELAELDGELTQAQQWKALTPGSSGSQKVVVVIEQAISNERERFDTFRKGITARIVEVKCNIDILEAVMSEAARSVEGGGLAAHKELGPDTDWEFVGIRPSI